MGIADVIPGVSGGTIALITGIYEELIVTLDQLGFQSLLTSKKKGLLLFGKALTGTSFLY